MINYIELTPGIKTPKGNFAFLYDLTGQAELFEQCLNAEKLSRKHYNNCLNELRSAMELLAYDLERKHRLAACGGSKSPELVLQEIKDDIRMNHNPEGGSRTYNVKTILKNEIWRRSIRANALMEDYKRFVENGPSIIRKQYADPSRQFTLINMIYDLYGYFSEGSHSGGHTTGEECESLLRLFHDMVALFYDTRHAYHPYLCPVGDYFPVERSLYKSLCLVERSTPDVYVTEENGAVEYFLLKKASSEMSRAQEREMATLRDLWRDSLDSPNNILHMQEPVGADQYRHQVFAFPSRPQALTDSLLQTLSPAEKDELAVGLIKGVASLHGMTPPFPHRGLNPDAFYICRNAGGIKPFIVSFDTVKFFSANAEYTVFDKVRKLGRDKCKQFFMAPEILSGRNDGNLLKADIFSLGKLLAYLYTGDVLLAEGLPEDMQKEKRRLIEQMTDRDPEHRPSISQVLARFLEIGIPKPSYALCSVKGKRREQEDSFFCSEIATVCGQDELLGDTAQLPLILGVYDGLGGGENGQDMSRLAAEKTHSFCQSLLHYELDSYSRQLRSLTEQMAKEAEHYKAQEDLEDAGTTMAVAILTKRRLHMVNVGDSRIYRISGDRMEQISRDHRYAPGGLKKGELYQYIGMSQEEFTIDPYIREEDYLPEDYILLCTDGFSDSVSAKEALDILQADASLEQKALNLVDRALENGSKDNITVILYTRGDSDERW